MLKFLRINNIALASRVELELGAGLTLLTGETGTGKSILVDSLGLLLGTRASADMVRTGEEQAQVEAIVEAPAALALLEARALPVDGPEIVLRREVSVSGKGRATVNGALVPLAVLRELGPLLATIHGQHEPQGLLDPATHLDILDAFAHVSTEAVALAYRRMRTAEAALAQLQRDRRERERRLETLRYQVEELERAQVQPHEDEDLRQEKLRCQNAGHLSTLCVEAYALLYEEEEAVLSRLGQAYKRVEELAQLDSRFAPYVEARAEIRARLEDLAFFLRDYSENVETDPARLDEIESRLALLERLKRKYGATLDEVLAFAESCRAELRDLESPEGHEGRLREEQRAAAQAYLDAARGVSERRREAARELERRVETELGLLAMERTRFRVSFEPAQPVAEVSDTAGWSERGLEQVQFLLSPNPGEELRPLARIASGGELSRILLALTAAADLDGEGRTLVFDEVDAGIGGRVAEVLGRKLRVLARRHQVLCVTHLPQIAAFAERHYAVRKRVGRGRTVTEVVELSAAERVEEIARMLGGEVVTESARRHAGEMLRHSLPTSTESR
jgi:DNA repair protein RecN (Recombination protein N)